MLSAQEVTTSNNKVGASQEEQKDIQPTKDDPKERLSEMISKYGKKKGAMIANGRVWPTISFDMARDSWGEPDKIQKSTTHGGTTEKMDLFR